MIAKEDSANVRRREFTYQRVLRAKMRPLLLFLVGCMWISLALGSYKLGSAKPTGVVLTFVG